VNTLSYKTKSIRKEDVQRKWFIVDAEGEIVGRMATQIAHVLRGKHKTSYTPHIDNGDFVIVVNAKKLRFTGNKMEQKTYQRFSGYPGGLRSKTAKEVLDKNPADIIEKAVRGMLPKNRLGRAMFKKLFVYAGPDHPHQAQKPESLKS
jgi:large subunit ribosomal protein L13